MAFKILGITSILVVALFLVLYGLSTWQLGLAAVGAIIIIILDGAGIGPIHNLKGK